MRELYYVGTGCCGTCKSVLREVIRPLEAEMPGRVHVVDTKRYAGDLARIDGRGTIKTVPVCVVEEDGIEVARMVGGVTRERLLGLLMQ